MAKPSISANFFIILILFISITPHAYSNNNQTDFEALLAFKKSVDDDPLRALTSWNETTHFCRWNGVSCSKRHPDRVVSLTLRSQGLVGSLSPHVGNLSFLRTIILQNNTFHGLIPQEIGRLKRLEIINFSNNSFEGEIPRNLSQCKKLNVLNLIDNELIGPIFPEIASLETLRDLSLTSNMLSGTIPPFLGNLTNLALLSLGDCGLHGQIPQSLVQLRKLEAVIMSGNSLTGSIPVGFFNLSTIKYFAFRSNQLHGTIPSFTFPKLLFLDLTSNHFGGVLPASLSNSSLVQRVYLSNNNFTGEMIDLTRLSALERLVVPYNQLEGEIGTVISSLSNSTLLQALELDGNLFTGSLPDSIGNLSTNLFDLSIGENQLSGTIPSSIQNLVGLTVLGADASNLQGPIPSSIGKLDNLQRIYLRENRLTNEIPSSFGNLTLLNYLLLESNDLSGNIPKSLANCTNLSALDLSRNSLNGSIPPKLLTLSSISIFIDLSHNVLTSTIPPEIGALTNLAALYLSHNRLTGAIPTALSSCVMLDTVYLDGNSLQGNIADSLKDLRGLQYLDLSQNNFSGEIPTFLAEFSLLYLNLSFNAFQGEVPTLGVFQNESAFSLQGNHDLCGGISVLNLPRCLSPVSNKKFNSSKILIPAVGAVCLALSVLWFFVVIYRRRKLRKAGSPTAALLVPEFLRLSYTDLLNATSGFSESNLLGAGRFGSVYKGTIVNDDDEQRNVAVKVLNLNIRGAYKSLAAECNALRGIRHRNLLKIISVCDSIDFQGNDFKALVFEFMPNGSLESWLHQSSSVEEGRILSIIQRLDIAINIASGVEYLHSGTDSIVVHGDLKPSNILLDHDMVAHVGDFGLARIISSISQNLSLAEGSSTSSAIKGTIGYIPPENGMNDIVSTKGDVYSYGVLVLEMFTNIRPTSDALFGHVNLQDFVSSAIPDRVMEVVDPFLHQQLNKDEKHLDCIGSILKIGVRCSSELPRDRMFMPEVVNELKRIRRAFLADRHGSNIVAP